MTKTNFIEADVIKNNDMMELDIPNITYDELPYVSVLTITYNRSHFFQLMWNNWNNYKYPKEKLEWVIVDDSSDPFHDLTNMIPKYPNIKYIKLDNHMSVGEKRNYGVEQCSHPYIVHQDDDDYYFPDSILAKVRVLKRYPKCGCCFSNNLSAYNILNNISYVMDPQVAESCLSLPEASLMYKKTFWEQQKFPTDHFGEGKGFAIDREKKFVSIPCIFNMVAFTHSRNMTGMARNIETKSIKSDPSQLANYYDLFDSITKNIIRKLKRINDSELKPTTYKNVQYCCFPHEEIECTENYCKTKTLGLDELKMFQHLDNWHFFDHTQQPDLNADLILICWYCTDILNISDKDTFLNSKTKLPNSAINLLKLPNSKLLVYNSWECRNVVDPYMKGEFCKYCIDVIKVPIDKVILATTDFLNPLIHSLAPQIIGYDFPYLNAKANYNIRDITTNPPESRTKTIITLNRRGNIERTAISLFLHSWYKDKCHISYLSKDKYDIKEINNLGVPTLKYDHFIDSLPLVLPEQDNKTIDTVASNIYGKEIVHVDWENVDSVFEAANDSFVMLTIETNTFGPCSNVQQVSEKTYKAIRLGMPFILFTGRPGILKHLKRIGFKTFHPHIDESYDMATIHDNTEDTDRLQEQYNKRFRKLTKELNRLCKLSHSELISLWNKCQPIVCHNLEVLRSTESQYIKEIPIVEN